MLTSYTLKSYLIFRIFKSYIRVKKLTFYNLKLEIILGSGWGLIPKRVQPNFKHFTYIQKAKLLSQTPNYKTNCISLRVGYVNNRTEPEWGGKDYSLTIQLSATATDLCHNF